MFLLASLGLLARRVTLERGSTVALILAISAAAVWLIGSSGLAFSGTHTLVAWRIAAATLTSWAIALGAAGYLPDASISALPGALSFLISFHPELRKSVAYLTSREGELRIPLNIPPLLALFAITPASFFAGLGVGAPVLVVSALKLTPFLVAAMAAGLVLLPVLVISSVRLERRWLVIAPRGLVIHDPFMLSSALRIPPDAVDHVEIATLDWRARVEDPAKLLDLTAGTLSPPVLLKLRRPIEAPQPRHIRIGTPFPPGGYTTLVAVCPTTPKETFAALARSGYARPGEFVKLETPETTDR